MKIGLMGGSFDPVHRAHINAAIKVKEALSLDKIIFIPAFISPFKLDTAPTKAEHRYNMLCLATKEYPFFEVSRFELDNGGTSYTYITVEHFAATLQDDELFFIMGDEAYRNFGKWKHPERIKKAAKICVVTRDEIPVDDEVFYVDIPPVKISSTEIRKRLQNGEDTDKMLCKQVRDYIKKHNLYKG